MIKRIEQFIKNQGISVRSFEQAISASDGMIRRAINNGTDIQSKWIEKIAENYPQINLNWLITGNGEMFIKENAEQSISPQQNDFIYKMYQEKEKQVQKLTEELRAMERKVGNLEAELKHAETLGYRTARNVSTKKPSSQPKADAPSASVPLNEQ